LIASAKLEAERKKLCATSDDMNVIQSALCEKVRHLDARQDVDAKRINDLESQSRVKEQVICARNRELAALSTAVLEAEQSPKFEVNLPLAVLAEKA